MRVLVIGDSITAGSPGVSFISALRASHQSIAPEKRGVSGEPLYNIADRLVRLLKKGKQFDVIVIQAGTNDILLPEFEKRGGLFRWSVRRERRHDIKPLSDIAKFRNLYTVLLKEVRLYSKARIILVNIPRINEQAPPALLDLQRQYNAVIARLASDNGFPLADVSSAFEQYLAGNPGTDYLCRSFWNTAIWDRMRCILPGQADKLSRRRNLQLTMDGVHPNSKGAAMFADAIAAAVGPAIVPEQLQETREFYPA